MTRHSTSARLRGLELPDCFAEATSASVAIAETRTHRRPGDARDLKRLRDQERGIERRQMSAVDVVVGRWA